MLGYGIVVALFLAGAIILGERNHRANCIGENVHTGTCVAIVT